MECSPALKTALDLLHVPSQAARIRAGPLPGGVHFLLRIAAGDTEATNQAAVFEGRSPDTVREAASFFLEQALLHADADSYRVLGVTREAKHTELRHNMTLLLQWLHPDLDRRDGRSVFAARVTGAWNDLKTPERRAAYDRTLHLARVEKSGKRDLRPMQTSLKRPSAKRRLQYRRYSALSQLSPPQLGFLLRVVLLLLNRSRSWLAK